MTVAELNLGNVDELKKQLLKDADARELAENIDIDQLKQWLEKMDPRMPVWAFARRVRYAYRVAYLNALAISPKPVPRSQPKEQPQAQEQPVAGTPELRALADEIWRSFREEDR